MIILSWVPEGEQPSLGVQQTYDNTAVGYDYFLNLQHHHS